MRKNCTSPTVHGAITASGNKVNEFQTTGAVIDMSIYVKLTDQIKYEVIQPREFGAGFTLPGSGISWRNRNTSLGEVKRLMIDLGLQHNVDFKIEIELDGNRKVLIRLAIGQESAESMILLNWNSFVQGKKK